MELRLDIYDYLLPERQRSKRQLSDRQHFLSYSSLCLVNRQVRNEMQNHFFRHIHMELDVVLSPLRLVFWGVFQVSLHSPRLHLDLRHVRVVAINLEVSENELRLVETVPTIWKLVAALRRAGKLERLTVQFHTRCNLPRALPGSVNDPIGVIKALAEPFKALHNISNPVLGPITHAACYHWHTTGRPTNAKGQTVDDINNGLASYRVQWEQELMRSESTVDISTAGDLYYAILHDHWRFANKLAEKIILFVRARRAWLEKDLSELRQIQLSLH